MWSTCVMKAIDFLVSTRCEVTSEERGIVQSTRQILCGGV